MSEVEDREWLRTAFAKILADMNAAIRATKAEAHKRGLSDGTIEWAMCEANVPEVFTASAGMAGIE